jgi:hypothetical protein
METTLIVGGFVIVGITAVAISTFSDKVKNALNFKEQEDDLYKGLMNPSSPDTSYENQPDIRYGGNDKRLKNKSRKNKR